MGAVNIYKSTSVPTTKCNDYFAQFAPFIIECQLNIKCIAAAMENRRAVDLGAQI